MNGIYNSAEWSDTEQQLQLPPDLSHTGNAKYNSETPAQIATETVLRRLKTEGSHKTNLPDRNVAPILKEKYFQTELRWTAERMDHRGHLHDNSGTIFLGDCQKFAPHGKGALILANGTTYEGMWENGRAKGFMKITLPEGFTAYGNWESGLPDDKGISIHNPNGATATASKSQRIGFHVFWG